MENKPTVTQRGRYRLKYRDTECLNCGHRLSLTDKFCSNCSQANSNKKLSLKDYFDEFFSSLISYDSKLLKTLSALLLKPGRITKDYINGKRVSYTNPFRFLLSLAIIYFLIINYSGNFSDLDRYGVKTEDDLTDYLHIITSTGSVTNDSIIDKEIDSLQYENDYRNYLDETRRNDSVNLADPKAHFRKLENQDFMERMIHKISFFRATIRKDSIFNLDDALVKYEIDDTIENQWTFNASKGILHLQSAPGSFISALISKLPFVVFFFLPVFAIFIWLVYIRKKYSYTDHLLFSFHNTSLLFILLIISYLIDYIFNVDSNGIFLTIFSIYLFQAMRKFYQQNVFKTMLKYVFLNTIFFILALFSSVIFFAGTIFTY